MRELRPIVETGYENILLVRLLIEEVRRDFDRHPVLKAPCRWLVVGVQANPSTEKTKKLLCLFVSSVYATLSVHHVLTCMHAAASFGGKGKKGGAKTPARDRVRRPRTRAKRT